MRSFSLVVAVLFAVAYLIELVVLVSWYSPYYRSGIVVFRRRYPAPRGLDLEPHVLRQRFKARRDPAFLFHRLSANEIAFRERLFQFRLVNHTPIMRGLLELDSGNRSLTITGRLQWGIIPLALLVVLIPLAAGPIPGLIFPIGLALTVVILLAIDRGHFDRLAARLADQSITSTGHDRKAT